MEKNQNKIIRCKELSEIIKQDVKQQVEILNQKGVFPKLAVIIAGDNPASQTYVKGKIKDCDQCGIISTTIALPQDISQQELLQHIEQLNNDNSVHGILVQLPLPNHIDEYEVINAISPLKDIDGFTAINVGNLYIGKDSFIPCTPQACIDVLHYAGIDLESKDVVIVGRSNIVGKPAGALFMQYNATVTICHSKSKDLAKKTKHADIVVMAIGKAGFLTGEMIKEDSVIVDVGINLNQEGKLCGDADFDSCIDKVSKITPVPGGIGLITRANLLKNTVKAAINANK